LAYGMEWTFIKMLKRWVNKWDKGMGHDTAFKWPERLITLSNEVLAMLALGKYLVDAIPTHWPSFEVEGAVWAFLINIPCH
jgi:hypothetical protein